MKIRRATDSDADSIRALYRDTIRNVNCRDYDPEQIEVWSSGGDDREKWLKRIDEQFFIAAEDGYGIIGFASVTHDGYIDFMFTHKDHQGRGVASAMYEVLEQKALSLGLREVWAEVSITARPFFRSRGFEITELFEKEAGGVVFDDCIMRKKISG
ncbi:MAG: GNAT family N-acetyltransferase [Ignavibacteria bacterium]|nr:GNAT family N-acetyltransferase [Ignavibacteria bacterium]